MTPGSNGRKSKPSLCRHKMEVWFQEERKSLLSQGCQRPNSATRSLSSCPVSTSPRLELNLSFYRHPSSRLKGVTTGPGKLQAYIIPLMHNPQERASLLPYLWSLVGGCGEGGMTHWHNLGQTPFLCSVIPARRIWCSDSQAWGIYSHV